MKTDTFTCDTCKRAIDVDQNPTGISVFPRCVITANCRGLMSQVRKLFVIGEQYHTSGTSSDAWVQRPMMFDHKQVALRKVWTFKHNLGTMPILNVYISDSEGNMRPLDSTEYSLLSLTETTASISFDTARTGMVQCLVRQSANDIVVERAAAVSTVQTTRLIYNQGLVIAAKQAVSTVTLVINSTPRRTVTLRADPVSLAQTPWSGVSSVRINGSLFNVVALNAAELNVSNGVAASYWIEAINGVKVARGDAYVLLAKDPYQHKVDKVMSNVVDVASLNPTAQSLTSLVGSVLFCNPKLVLSIYPPMEQFE
jgi:hypothetical protein